jgi:hypothetical protein
VSIGRAIVVLVADPNQPARERRVSHPTQTATATATGGDRDDPGFDQLIGLGELYVGS